MALLMDKKGEAYTYAELGNAAQISTSEAHSAVQRLRESSLVNEERAVLKRNAREFLFHALRYLFPLKFNGGLLKGMPTAYSAPIAQSAFSASGLPPVWTGSNGTVLGRGIEPIYPTAPDAASRNPGLYDLLALFDMLRGGRIRERLFAEDKLAEVLT